MTARSRSRAERATRRAGSARTARTALPVRGLVVLALALAVVVTGFLVIRSWGRRGPGAHGGPGVALPDSIALLGPDSAYQRGARLMSAGHADRSLAYFRHAMTFPGDPAMAHAGYSSGLHNAAIQSRSRFGLMGLATRSSVERIALMRESLEQLDIAERMAATPAERATVHAMRAHRYVTWGMPWDALAEFHGAQTDDPPGGWEPRVAELVARLHHPERPAPRADPLAASP